MHKVFEHIDILSIGIEYQPYTVIPTLRFRGSGSLVESKCCDYVVVDADSHLKLLTISVLDLYKVFEHIDMLSIVVQ
jgi:hypothetical protein